MLTWAAQHITVATGTSRPALFYLQQDAFSPVRIPEPAWECAFISMSLQRQVFGSNKSSVASLKPCTEAGKIHFSNFIVK